MWCKNLEGVELCEGIEKIEKSAFCGCDELKIITVPSDVLAIHFQVGEAN